MLTPRTLLSQRYDVQKFRLEDGLPSSRVHGLGQDPEGRVVLSTAMGLARLDGLFWTLDQRSPRSTGGLFWAPGEARPWLVDTSDEVRLTVHEPTSQGWLAHRFDHSTGRGGIQAMVRTVSEGSPATPTYWFSSPADGLIRWTKRGGWRAWSIEELGLEEPISSIASMAGSLYLATGRGLHRWNPELDSAIREEALSGEAVHGLIPDPEREALWVIADDRILRLAVDQDGTVAQLEFPTSPAASCAPADCGSKLFPSSIGPFVGTLLKPTGLVFGDQKTLWSFHPTLGLQRLGRAQGFLDDGANGVFVDAVNALWISSPEGVARLENFSVANYDLDFALPDVTVLRQIEGGRRLIANPNSISSLNGLVRTELARLPTVPGQRIFDLEIDPQGRLWIAAGAGGLFRLDLETSPARLTRVGVGGLDNWVSAVERFGESSLALATDEGLALIDTKSGAFEWLLDQDEALPRLRNVERTRDGEGLWILTHSQGIALYRDNRLETWKHPENRLANFTWAVLDRPGHEPLVGTAVGVFTLGQRHQLERAHDPRLQSLSSSTIFSIKEAPDRSLWFGLGDGYLRFDEDSVLHLAAGRGLVGQEANREALMVTEEGEVWLGTDRGLAIYQPLWGPPTSKPEVHFVGLRIDDGSINSSNELITLPASHRSVTFEVDVGSPVRPHLLELQARLDDEDWGQPRPAIDRQIRFGRLPAGSHRLQVRARVKGEPWGPTTSAPELVAEKPYWSRAWFLVLVLAAAGIAAFTVYHVLATRAYSKRLELALATQIRQLEVSEERYRHAIAGIDDAVVAVDGDGLVVTANPAAEAMMRSTRDDACGKPVDHLIRLKSIEFDGQTVRPLIFLQESSRREGETRRVTDVVFLDANGDERLVEITASPTPGADGRAGTVYVVHDVTEQRLAEEETAKVERLESIGLLAGGIAHDFNNLLAVILGNLGMLSSSLVRRQERECCLEAEQATLRAKDLTQQLLTFSRGGAPVRRSVPIEPLLRDCCSLVLSGSSVAGVVSVDPDLPPAYIDAGQVYQVISNLLINATEVMGTGGAIRLVARLSHASPTQIEIRVIDEGPGIPEDMKHRIFDAYFTTKSKGTGLGLFTAFSIIRRHGGTLALEDTGAGGSTFVISLPVANDEPEVLFDNDHFAGQLEARVLLMDDEPALLRMASKMLTRQGMEVVVAEDGAVAVSLYRAALGSRAPFDLAIMDLTVPGGMGGLEASRQILEFDPDATLIVCSGYANDPIMAEYKQHGFRSVLSKPYRATELTNATLEALRARANAGGGELARAGSRQSKPPLQPGFRS